MSLRRQMMMGGGQSSAGPALPNLIAQGLYFAREAGEPFTAIECSDFNLLARYSQEGWSAILPVLQQRQACGFNVLRVWTAFDIPLIGTYPICAYQKIPAFVSLCAGYGLYVEFTAYTGQNDPEHWTRLIAAALQCRPFPLLELVNELDQNENEPDARGRVFELGLHAQAPAPLLSAHGSNGSQTWPIEPPWSYATFHTNGAYQEARKVGHNAREIWHGPTLTNETSRCPDNYASTQQAYDMAAGAGLLCAGACFHSVHGKTSQLWEGIELDCAKAFADGARSISPSCHGPDYKHRTDLEGPAAGATGERVYQVGSSDTCIVHIRPEA